MSIHQSIMSNLIFNSCNLISLRPACPGPSAPLLIERLLRLAQLGPGPGCCRLQAALLMSNEHQNVLMSVPPLPPVLHPSYAAHRGTRAHYHKHAAALPSPAPKWSLLCLMGIFADKNQFNHIQPARLIRAQNCKTPNKERWMMVFSSLN